MGGTRGESDEMEENTPVKYSNTTFFFMDDVLGVCALRQEDRLLPLLQALQVEELVAALARTRCDQVARACAQNRAVMFSVKFFG